MKKFILMSCMMILCYANQASATTINFNSGVLSYAPNNQDYGSYIVLDGGSTLELVGNTWKYITFTLPDILTVKTDSVLSFLFKTTLTNGNPEIAGIGFDNNSDPNNNTNNYFNIYGSQSWGNKTYKYTDIGEWQQFDIPVGQYFTGSFSKLVFVSDDDTSGRDNVVYFRNVSVHTPEPATMLLMGAGALGAAFMRRGKREETL